MAALDLYQCSVGPIADFNLWDYEMTGEEIKGLTCADKGNIVNMDSLKIAGDQDLYENIAIV